ncbi:MAG: hypothetical protein IJ518_05075 [Clostridia bacterium]|nr:hypothetical protein [Clostridia bacterium]
MKGCVNSMENEKNTGRVWLIILAVLAVLAAVLVVLYRLDKRVQRLYYQLGYKLTPKKNAPIEVEL